MSAFPDDPIPPPDDPVPSPSVRPDPVDFTPWEEPIPQVIERLDLVSEGPRQYEFTSAQGDLIADLARKMRFVGLLMIAVGILNPILTWIAFHAIALDITFLIYILIGAWTWSASGSFQKVVDTKGKDINHLMDAMESLRRIYGFIFYLVIIGITIAGILIFWSAFGGQAAFHLGGSPLEGQ